MSDFDAWIDWDAAARAAQAEQTAREQAEINQFVSMYTPSQNLGKIEGLPTNPLDPSTASLGYKQGAYSYNGYWGQPIWSQGNIVGYEFVKHDITPGMMSVIRTDAQGNIANTQLGPEGEGISFRDVVSMAAPYALMAFPGLGQAIGASLGATGAAATALGNAAIGGTLAEASGGDFMKGALAAGAGSLASGYVAPAISEAVGSQAIGQALTSGALAELKGGDFLQGAIQGGISGATKDAQLNLADKYINAVEPGIGYDSATSPTELDVIQAFPELAPVDDLTKGVTDILNYAANAPSVQLAAGPNYVGEFTGMEYDPNQGAYRLEIGGAGDQQGTEPSDITVPTQEQAQLDVADLINQLEPYLAQNLTMEDIQSIIGQQNFATPDDIQTAINSINIPQGLSQSDVESIVSNAIANNPNLTTTDIQDIVNTAISNIPAGLTAEDVTDILGQQNFATPEDIQTAISGIQFPEGMTPEDVQGIVSEAFKNNPGITSTEVQDIVQGALNNLPPGLSSADVSTIVNDAISNLPSAPTQQDIIDIIGGQGLATSQDLGNLAEQLGLTQEELFNQLGKVEQGFVEQLGNVQTSLESQLGEQGKQLFDALQQQGVDYTTALNEAINAQNTNFAEYQSATESALGGLAEQLGLTQQQLIDQLNQTQESFGTQFSELQNQFSNLDTANAERYADLIKTVGLLGTGLGTIQSMFKSAQEAAAPKQFEIVATPSEWKSPTYNLPQAGQVPFTPSAPIDFGSRELLKGTQWENSRIQPQQAYSLSNLVNTLNYQSVPFTSPVYDVQPSSFEIPEILQASNTPTTVATTDIIGNLNGKPMSIADIISGIQSGQTYSS